MEDEQERQERIVPKAYANRYNKKREVKSRNRDLYEKPRISSDTVLLIIAGVIIVAGVISLMIFGGV